MKNTDADPLDSNHRFLTVNGVQLHYVEAGRGDPVLLIAGWPQTWYAWRRVAPLFVAAGRRVILVDPRGLGDSEKPISGYDLDTAAQDIYALLAALDLIGRSGVDIVSHDIGSWISFALASAAPGAVRRLVLSEMTVLTPDTSLPIPDKDANIASWHFAFNRLPDLPEALVKGRERLFLDWLFDHKADRPEAIDAVAREHYASKFAAPGAAKAGFNYYRELLSDRGLRRMQERLAKPLPMPVLAIGASGGVRDKLAKSLERAAPMLRSTVLTGGHYLPEEASGDFAHAVLNFWRDERSG